MVVAVKCRSHHDEIICFCMFSRVLIRGLKKSLQYPGLNAKLVGFKKSLAHKPYIYIYIYIYIAIYQIPDVSRRAGIYII